jgi:acyl-CoA synthetase (AMP-forming)/AMP-acid ligase II
MSFDSSRRKGCRVELNIADLFEAVAQTVPDNVALVSGEQRLTFAELDARATRLASFMRAHGVRPGQHVGLHLFNGPEYVEGMLAAFKLRAVGINLNYRYVAHELAPICADADLVMLVSQAELAPIAFEAVAGLEKLRTLVLVADGSAVPKHERTLEVIDYEAAVASGDPREAFEPRSGDDLFVIYTGGTTGVPKGVMWRHADVFYAGLQGGNPGGPPLARAEDLPKKVARGEGLLNVFSAAPFIHGAAMWGALISMLTGGKAVFQPGRSFDPKRVCELIDREKPHSLSIVGDAMALPLIDELAANPDRYDVSSLFVISSAGAVLSESVQKRLAQLLPRTFIMNNFGSTEAGHQGSAAAAKGVDGRTSFNLDASTTVLDDDLKPIERGSGKLGRLARTGRLPIGYYNDPIKTAERFREIDGVRWVMPGDLATIEADGRITVLGRGSSCINTGGEKVFAEEVEEVLKGHPDVYDALVVGIDDPRWMQRVAAVISPRPGKRPTLTELQAHCRKSIAGYKVPREVQLVEAIARMPSGKPDYAWARRQLST